MTSAANAEQKRGRKRTDTGAHNIEWRPIGSLIPYARNARTHSEAQVALIAASVVHVLVYATYVWLVGRAGAVFTAQVSYLVTGFGLLWAWLLLGEAYAATLWLALGAMFVGMYLVQPRPRDTL